LPSAPSPFTLHPSPQNSRAGERTGPGPPPALLRCHDKLTRCLPPPNSAGLPTFLARQVSISITHRSELPPVPSAPLCVLPSSIPPRPVRSPSPQSSPKPKHRRPAGLDNGARSRSGARRLALQWAAERIKTQASEGRTSRQTRRPARGGHIHAQASRNDRRIFMS
jgi:hypothetical protein